MSALNPMPNIPVTLPPLHAGLFTSVPLTTILAWATGLVLASSAALFVYNYWFHPIAHVKGPFWATVTPLWLMRSVSRHRLNNDIEMMHVKYGPVVRIGPNELSFATEEAVKAIHNPASGMPIFTKKGTIEALLAKLIWSAPNLLTTHDKATHKRLRNALQPAFTAKALLEQEGIGQYHIDKAASKVAAAAAKAPETVFNLSEEMAVMIWDIVGDLSFGEPLLRDQRTKYEQLKYTYATGAPFLELFQSLTELPIFGPLAKLPIIITPHIYRTPKNFLLMNKLKACIDGHSGRKDFLTAIMAAKESANLSQDEMLSNSALFAMVGYDTTATTLSALFYLLLKDPPRMARLVDEIRSAYDTKADVTATNSLKLPYLGAVIQETLRLIPPINGRGSHRISPGAEVDGLWVPRGVNVSADPWTIGRSPRYWAEPGAFRPERWMPGENGAGSPWEDDVRSAWRPFLVGPRVCIGREMALQSIRLTTCKFLAEMDVEMVNRDFVWERDASNDYVWYDYDIFVRVTPRRRG